MDVPPYMWQINIRPQLYSSPHSWFLNGFSDFFFFLFLLYIPLCCCTLMHLLSLLFLLILAKLLLLQLQQYFFDIPRRQRGCLHSYPGKKYSQPKFEQTSAAFNFMDHFSVFLLFTVNEFILVTEDTILKRKSVISIFGINIPRVLQFCLSRILRRFCIYDWRKEIFQTYFFYTYYLKFCVALNILVQEFKLLKI